MPALDAPPLSVRKPIAAAALSVLACFQAGEALTKRKFDFIAGADGDFKAAMAAAAAGASAAKRYILFLPDGEYDAGGLTGNANQMTAFTASNVSFIGQSEDKTVVFNKSRQEGISITATLHFNKADDIYLQDLTVMNRANYGNAATYDETGRHVAVMEQGNKFIYKNVRLLSTQDTYYTKGTRTYWENGQIHGTTDFICGDGDVFFNGVLLYEMKKSAMTAPSTSTDWGYVFKDCIIDGDVSGFDLGRSWDGAKAVFLNATLRKLPSERGWGDPMNSNPVIFAEYKSVTSSGALVDLGKRRKSYAKEGSAVTLNPVLSDAEAARYTVANVLGGSDGWQPRNLARQIPAPVLSLAGSKLAWNDDPDALCWIVFKNGKYFANVAVNGFDAASAGAGDLFTVRAANAMGGLGAYSNAVKVGPATGVVARASAGFRKLHRRDQTLVLDGLGSLPIRFSLRDAKGGTLYRRVISSSSSSSSSSSPATVDLSPLQLRNGLYFATAESEGRPGQAFRIGIAD